MKYVKIGLMVVGGFALFVIGNIAFIVFGATKGVGEISKMANPEVTQEIQRSNGVVTISVPLEEQKGVKFHGIELCKPAGADPFFKPVLSDSITSSSQSCMNGNCEITLEVEENREVPSSLDMYVRRGNGACGQQTFKTANKISTVGYSATIEFTEELRNLLAITESSYDVDSTNRTGCTSWQIMGTKKVKLQYNTRPVADRLTINDTVKAKILFN